MTALDIDAIRAQFPLLERKVHGKPLVYLDNAATTQKPRAVLEAMDRYYRSRNANVHRAIHQLSQEATADYDNARQIVARFIHAADPAEVIFTRGTTESINLVAASWGGKFLKPGDEIILSSMEHHSNIVPWQLIAERTGAVIRVVPFNDRGELDMAEFDRLLGDHTRMVAIVHVSNSLGTVNPVRDIIRRAHAKGAVVLVDGAQWVQHNITDVADLDADFYAFSGHKIYGPTGIGVLYGKRALLEAMPPYQGGGDMIASVTFEKTTYAPLPNKFEAGTPNMAGAVGLSAAIAFVESIGMENIAAHEKTLLTHATESLAKIPGIRLIGTATKKESVISFVVENPPMSVLDVAIALDAEGIAVRTGHHCCQPAMDRLGVPATARASLAMYNTTAEIDALATALRKIVPAQAAKPARRTAAIAPATDLVFPKATAESPTAAADELVETFGLFGDWEQRHQYLLELGEKLPPMPAALKTEPNRVRGCMSTVHLWAHRRPGSKDDLEFLADSDAAIVRGLIALLQRVFSGQPAPAILRFNPEAMLKRLGLDQHLSMGRRNGLAGMIQRIRDEAAHIAESIS